MSKNIMLSLFPVVEHNIGDESKWDRESNKERDSRNNMTERERGREHWNLKKDWESEKTLGKMVKKQLANCERRKTKILRFRVTKSDESPRNTRTSLNSLHFHFHSHFNLNSKDCWVCERFNNSHLKRQLHMRQRGISFSTSLVFSFLSNLQTKPHHISFINHLSSIYCTVFQLLCNVAFHFLHVHCNTTLLPLFYILLFYIVQTMLQWFICTVYI